VSWLNERFKALQERYPGTMERAVLRDPYGVYSLHIQRPNGGEYYFCAKAKTAGSMVSVHQSLLEGALMYHRGIIMAIGWDFYRFDPKEIERLKLFSNERHGATMINFNMEIGTRLDGKPVRKKNDLTPMTAPIPSGYKPSPAMKALESTVMDLFDGEKVGPETR